MGVGGRPRPTRGSGLCHATEPPRRGADRPPADAIPAAGHVARTFRIAAGPSAAARAVRTRVNHALALNLFFAGHVKGDGPTAAARCAMPGHVAAIRALGISDTESDRFAAWLADRGWDRDGQWLGPEAAWLQRYGDTPLHRAVIAAPDLFTVLEAISAQEPALGAALVDYLWDSSDITPPPIALRGRSGLVRRLASLATAYVERLRTTLGLDPEFPAMMADFWRDIVTPPSLGAAQRALISPAAQFRAALEDLDTRFATIAMPLATIRALDDTLHATQAAADLQTLATTLAAAPLPGMDRLAAQIRAIHERRWADGTTLALPALPGLAATVVGLLWKATLTEFPQEWQLGELLTEHLRTITPPLPEAGLTETERARQLVPTLHAFTARVAQARDLLDLAIIVAEAPIDRLSHTHNTTRNDASDALRRAVTRPDASVLPYLAIFGIADRAATLQALQPRREVTPAEQQRAALLKSLERSHSELLQRVDTLGDATGHIGAHPVEAIRTVVADLLAGELISLLEVPRDIRAAIDAHLRNVISVATQLHTTTMQPEDGRNPLTHEWLRDNLPAQYRLAKMALDGWLERGTLPPPPVHLAKRAREFARDHWQWADWASQPFTAIVDALRSSFEDEAYIPWAEQFWQTADPAAKRLARELYFHRQLYREVGTAAAYRLWRWIGANGCIGEFGVVRTPRLGRERRLVARGDLFNVAPSVDGEVEAHTHPQFLQFTDREGRQGIAGVTVAVNDVNLTPAPSTHPTLPSEGDLDYIHGIGRLRNAQAQESGKTWNGRVTHALLHEHGGTLIVYDSTQRRFDLYYARNPANPGDEEWTQQWDRLQAWALDPGGPFQYRRPFTVALHSIQFVDVVNRRIPAGTV